MYLRFTQNYGQNGDIGEEGQVRKNSPNALQIPTRIQRSSMFFIEFVRERYTGKRRLGKSSVKENKDDAFKLLPNQEKVHESGRGEVAW